MSISRDHIEVAPDLLERKSTMKSSNTEPRSPMAGVILAALLLGNLWGFVCLMDGTPEYPTRPVCRVSPRAIWCDLRTKGRGRESEAN